MPRDANGNYVLPAENPVVSGTLITSTWANGTMPDIGSEIQDSLSRSGSGSMQAPLLILDDDGVNTPGLAFRDETDSGLKREATGDVRIVSQGQGIFRTNPTTKGPEGWDEVSQAWVSLLPQGTPGNPTNPETSADKVTYDNTTSGLTATDVQAAIDEQIANPPAATAIPYDNTTSGLTAAEVQAAIDELKGLLDALPPEYVNPNSFMAGKVQGTSGTKLRSTGLPFTSTRTGTGRYTITFDTQITGADYVIIPGFSFNGFGSTITVYEEDPGFFRVRTDDAESGIAQDRDWSFILYYST